MAGSCALFPTGLQKYRKDNRAACPENPNLLLSVFICGPAMFSHYRLSKGKGTTKGK